MTRDVHNAGTVCRISGVIIAEMENNIITFFLFFHDLRLTNRGGGGGYSLGPNL